MKILSKARRKKEFVDPSTIYELIQLEALEGKLINSAVAFERRVRRWYSQSFNTPLEKTFQVPWDQILINYFESNTEALSHNEAFDHLLQDFLPKYKEQAEAEDIEFVESLEEEQRRTMKKKAERDEEYRKKLEQLGETFDGINEKVANIEKKRQNIPKEMNLNFEDEEPTD